LLNRALTVPVEIVLALALLGAAATTHPKVHATAANTKNAVFRLRPGGEIVVVIIVWPVPFSIDAQAPTAGVSHSVRNGHPSFNSQTSLHVHLRTIGKINPDISY
jgi:hypothetical protein